MSVFSANCLWSIAEVVGPVILKDANRDGRLVIEEIEGVEATRFAAADKNGDGGLSMEEFLEARSVDFDAADSSNDGALSSAEVEGAK